MTIGVSGDADAARGLNAGCDAWYSVIGGLFPEVALALTRAAQTGRAERAEQESQRLQPLWDLFAQHGGSLRVVAAAAAHLGSPRPAASRFPSAASTRRNARGSPR